MLRLEIRKPYVFEKGSMMRSIVIAMLAMVFAPFILAAQQGATIPPPPDVAAPPADAVKTRSGLYYKVLSPGTGTEHPGPYDIVVARYTGWTTDGKMFDSSVTRISAVSFPVNRVIAGWGEAVQLMVAGEKVRVWIPQKLAYKGKEPKGTLVFEIELVSFSPSPLSPPPDVKAPPADATRTRSGLAYKSLKEGTGTTHPRSSSTVTVHYTGWTTDGKMFDSSMERGQPASFPLNGVIAGWTEGLQFMVEGQKMRFWIPEKLAYRGEREPYGMLVFDVELISIQ
jgi:FKBP-type peptidyl-prolyl cis-trans isomerase